LWEVPVIDKKMFVFAITCLSSLKMNRVPLNALVNGNWLGDVPPQIQNLTWIEKNVIFTCLPQPLYCGVTSSGMHKMSANAVFFSTPCQRFYASVPPKREELEEVMAFIS